MDYFIFQRAWDDALRDLPDESRLKIYDTLLAYAFDEDESLAEEMTPELQAVFRMAKPSIDYNRKVWNKKHGQR